MNKSPAEIEAKTSFCRQVKKIPSKGIIFLSEFG